MKTIKVSYVLLSETSCYCFQTECLRLGLCKCIIHWITRIVGISLDALLMVFRRVTFPTDNKYIKVSFFCYHC